MASLHPVKQSFTPACASPMQKLPAWLKSRWISTPINEKIYRFAARSKHLTLFQFHKNLVAMLHIPAPSRQDPVSVADDWLSEEELARVRARLAQQPPAGPLKVILDYLRKDPS